MAKSPRERAHVKGLPEIVWYYKGELLPDGKVLTQTRIGYDTTTGKTLTVRQVQTAQHGGVSFEKRRAGQVPSLRKEAIEKRPKKEKIDSFVQQNPGWIKVKGGPDKAFKTDYYQKGDMVISKYGASQVTSGKATLAEQLSKYKEDQIPAYFKYLTNEQSFRIKGRNRKQVFDRLFALLQFDDITQKRNAIIAMYGFNKIRYEGEIGDRSWRASKSTPSRIYKKKVFRDYLEEQTDGWFSKGEITEVTVTFHTPLRDVK